MTISLSAINKDFIIGLGQVIQGSSKKAFGSSGGSSESSKVQIGLRSGAQLYASAIQNLNSVGSAINIAKSTLEELLEITDKALVLTERSTKYSTQNSTRKKLDREFQALGEEFRTLVENAQLNDKDILTKDGIKELFLLVGLDEDRSSSLSNFLSSFVLSDTDDVFSSEEIKGPTPKLPAAVQPSTPAQTFNLDKISSNEAGNPVQNAFVTQVNSLYQDDDDELGQNPNGVNSLIIEGENSNLTSLPNAITSAVTVLGASEQSGYSVIVSNEDFLGFNAAGVNQLYLVDEQGSILHQYTDFSANYTITGADISSDGLNLAFVTSGDPLTTNADGSDELFRVSVSTALGAAPMSADLNQLSSNAAGTSMTDSFISEDGSYAASLTSGTVTGVQFYDVSTGAADAFLASDGTISKLGGFIGGDTLAYTTGSGQIVSHQYNSGSSVNIYNAGTANNLVTSESGYVAYNDSSNISYLYAAGGATTDVNTALTLGGSDTISQLSITDNLFGSSVDIGVLGVLASQTSDSDTEFWRLRENVVNTNSVLPKPDEYTEIFEGSIKTRSNAFRVRSDLKALHDQIEDNITSLDEGLSYLQDNIDIVRATGLAMLNLSDQILSAGDASNIAKKLAREIRSNASFAALAQAENLSPIAAAALVSLQDS